MSGEKNKADLAKLTNGHDIEADAVCLDYHHSGRDWDASNGCSIDYHDWGAHTKYDCHWHGYGKDHEHYNEAVHGHHHHHHKGHHHHRRRRHDLFDDEGNAIAHNHTEIDDGTTRSEEEAEERWGGYGYEKVSKNFTL